MTPALNRLPPLLLFALLLGMLPAVSSASTPVFLSGTSSTGANPYYPGFNTVPVGKTLVVPIAISGSGPMTYTVTSTSPRITPVIKTGYPVMNIHVTYSGTTGAFSTLYSFTGGNDGGSPYAGLIAGSSGDLYGTTETDGSNGNGTVYRLTTSGSLTTLYSFTGGTDGGNPYAGLDQGSGGNLYGTAEIGGSGFGTVFKVTTSGSLTTLHPFAGGADGGNPFARLVTGTDGNLYGTTRNNGAHGFGAIFQLTTSGSLATLYSFTGGNDGANPYAGLIQGTNGDFYGTTLAGGVSGVGTVFQITASGSLTTLHSFTGVSDGGTPYAGLTAGTGGIFYGATETGGSGFGTVFQITTSGSLTTLYPFTGGNDGANPYAAPIQGTDGNLYGTTETDGSSGFGTVYQLTAGGSLTTLHSFTGGSDGGNPYGSLLQGSTGTFYGTTKIGGADGHGAVFQIPLPNSGSFGGTMSFALLRDMAPVTTGYIAGFAQAGYYNGLDFWRISNLGSSGSNEFIAQGGDPTNTGTGNPGFTIDNEFNPSLIFTGQGQLAMANSGINQNTFLGTNGSQFFITQSPTRGLDFGYTIFGQLLTGFDVMRNIMAVPVTDGTFPVSPVVMDFVSVSEDRNDAILLVNAAGLVSGAAVNVSASDPSGNKAVVLTGTVATPGLSISMSTQADTLNDPPIIETDPEVNLPLHQGVSLPIKAQDLEFDYLITGAQSISPASFASLSVNASGNLATVTPSSFSPIGSDTVGLFVYQPYVSVPRSNMLDQTAVTVGLGLGNLTSLPALLSGTANGPLAASTAIVSSSTFGSVLASNPGGAPDDFTAAINWGDGNLTSGSNNVFLVHSPRLPTEYDIVAPSGHAYANPGIYPVNVTVTDSNGGVLEVQNTAVVSPGPIYPFGRTFTVPAGVANCEVATFIDHTPGMTAAGYKATINWGDGAVALGNGIVRGSNGNFQVYGAHKYIAGSTYPVDITVSSTNGNSGYAWSTASLIGVPTHQPPVAQSHVTGQIGDPGFDGDFLSEEVVLFNSGNLPSGPIALQFYLSPTSATQPIDPSAIPLSVGKFSTYNTPSIPAGSAIQGAVSEITLPANAVTRGKFIIMQVITSDPVANYMFYPHAFSDSFPLIE